MPMSGATPWSASPLIYPIGMYASGASEDAKLVRQALERVESHMLNSVSGQALNRVIYEISALAEELSVENWDGYGAAPISPGSSSAAIQFLSRLPSIASMPEVVPDPDGSIALEWERGSDYWLLLNFSSDWKISYAAKFGENRAKGTEEFSGTVPPEIYDKIYRIFKEGN